MTREEAIKYLIQPIVSGTDIGKEKQKELDAYNMAIKALEQEPSNDMVSLGVFEQVMWERDVAIEQLKDLGYGFGEKPKVGHWIYDRTRDCDGECKYECSECGMGSDVEVKPQESEDKE